MAGPIGQFLSRVIDFDYAGRNGFALRMADVSAREFSMMRRMEAERQKYESEEIKRSQEDAQLRAKAGR